jgi:hypothetical protein
VLEAVPKVEAHRSNPCWQQRQIAAQQSYIKTAETGKETVIAAPCAPTPNATASQKTS